MKDSVLNRKLKNFKLAEQQPPEDITRNTVNRILCGSDPENSDRIRKLLAKAGHSSPSSYPLNGGSIWMRKFGIVAAACLLLAVGFLSTWGALTWFSGPGTVAGQNIDLTQDSRIVVIQQDAPFQLALPSWMPRDYSLAEVTSYPSGPEKEHFSVQMTFLGPNSTEPLILTQSNELWQSFDRDRTKVVEARIGQTPALLAEIYHYPKGPLVSRRLVFALSESFVIIESGVPRSPYDQLADLGTVLSNLDLLEIAKGIVGSNHAEVIPSNDDPDTDEVVPGLRSVLQFASAQFPYPILVPDVHQTYYFDSVILEATLVGGQLRYYTELVISYAPPLPSSGYQITVNQTDYTPVTRLGAAKMPIDLGADTPGAETIDLWETQGYYGLVETEGYGKVPHLIFQADGTTIVISSDGRASKEQIIAIAESMLPRPHITGIISEITDNSILIVSGARNPISSQGNEAIWFKLSAETLVLDGLGNEITLSNMEIGQAAEAWHTGVVMDSYPQQAEAVKIIVSTLLEPKPSQSQYTSTDYGVSFDYPSNWMLNPGYEERYEGDDGFFSLSALSGNAQSIDEIVSFEVSHHLMPYGSNPQISKLTIQGQEARLILPSSDQQEVWNNHAGLIIRYPTPVKIGDSLYHYLALYADKDHIQQIGQSVIFP